MMKATPSVGDRSHVGRLDPGPGVILEAVGRARGRDLSGLDDAFVARVLAQRLAATGAPGPETYAARLVDDPAEVEVLADALENHHSELFRDPLTWALLEQRVLPELADASPARPLRAWSAGCAAGQEAYSLALLLLELVEARGAPVPFRLLATDVSPNQIAQARTGFFPESALGNVRLRHAGRWFMRSGAGYVATAALRQAVDFSVHDLLDPTAGHPPASIFGGFDLVLCCNVLIYYRSSVQRLILDRLADSLVPGGLLVTGAVEREAVLAAGSFRPVAGSLFRLASSPDPEEP